MGSTLAAEPIFAVMTSKLLATHKLTQDVPNVPASWADSEVDEGFDSKLVLRLNRCRVNTFEVETSV